MTLAFQVLDAVPEPYAATPTLILRLRVTDDSDRPVSAIALRAQVRIEPQRRQYTNEEAAGLVDQFGSRERWRDTLRPFLWVHATAMLRGFSGELEFDLPIACTYDLEVIGTKYLHALRDGEVPLALLFSGTAFRPDDTNGLGVEQIPWHLEANYRLPVAVWRAVMDRFFPNSGWLRLDRDTLDALIRYRSEHGLISWETTVDRLLAAVGSTVTGPTVARPTLAPPTLADGARR
jgi:Family of unknown function (DUF6084)